MQFTLTETQELLKDSARKFFSVEYPLGEVRRIAETDAAFDETLWSRMAEQGWIGVMLPERYEGMDLSLPELAVLLEEMGRAMIPGPYLATLAAETAIAAAAGEETKMKYLPAICRGELRASLALLEAGASWDPARVSMAATPADGGFILCGRKLFVQDAAVAGLLVCAVRIAGEPALVMVDPAAAGVTIESLPALDGTRRLYAVDFRDVAVRPDNVLATGDRAQSALEKALDIGTVGLLMEMVGGMQRVLELTVEYAKTRKQFGKPIGQFQAVQHLCADMYLLTESSRSAAYGAAWAVSENQPDARQTVAVAKVYAGDAYREVGNRAIQVHGGMGFTWENDLHLYYRRAKAAETLFGDNTYHRERLAAYLVK